MAGIFEIMTVGDRGAKGETGVAIGISVKIGGNETICPVTGVFNSMDSLVSQVKSLNKDLEDILTRAKIIIEGSSSEMALDFHPDMSPSEIWAILSSITDEKLFTDIFNNMDEQKRKELAGYVLESCSSFSGKGSVFSSRYNNNSGLIE
jgi:hypothetical protein